MMNRDALLALHCGRVEKVEIPGIGQMGIRVLNAREALELYEQFQRDKSSVALAAAQLSAFIADDAGGRLLSEEDALKVLDGLSATQVREIIGHGTRMNALDDEAVEKAGGN